jgi:hypothetical protein
MLPKRLLRGSNMKLGSWPLRGWLAALMLPVPALAQLEPSRQLEPSKIHVAELGPQVGEIVPDFSLPDQNGEIWTRASIMGPNGAMLVFIRSAEW